MDFELLPNEIFLDIFDYLDGTDLIYAFHGLNSRFNRLLYQNYHTFRFDFSSVSKHHFDVICREHLPSLAHRLITLSFAHPQDIPGQTGLFLSHIPSFDLFTHLRSLTLSEVNNHETTVQIIARCQQLYHLTHLKVYFCYFDDETHFQSTVDGIWTLPKLVHCEMNLALCRMSLSVTPTRISSSLQHLSLEQGFIGFHAVSDLCRCTPRLEDLSISIENYSNSDETTLLPTLTTFKLCIAGYPDTSEIVTLLQNMPSLRSLDLDLSNGMIHGYQWEHLITHYLPELKKLRFRMSANALSDENPSERMNQLIAPFRSPFWRDQHRWFVRCYADRWIFCLCTIPYTLLLSNPEYAYSFLSTDPDDNLQTFCTDLTHICGTNFLDDPELSNIRFTNIEKLQIGTALDDQFWSVVPTLTKLHSLAVFADVPHSGFQDVFNRAPHLGQLTIRSDKFTCLHLTSLEPINCSLRQLHLNLSTSDFSEEEYLLLARSPLGAQCEVLSITFCNRENVLTLANNMSRLRLMKIFCPRERCYKTSAKDELIQWLRERLPSAYIIRIPRLSSSEIRIWL